MAKPINPRYNTPLQKLSQKRNWGIFQLRGIRRRVLSIARDFELSTKTNIIRDILSDLDDLQQLTEEKYQEWRAEVVKQQGDNS